MDLRVDLCLKKVDGASCIMLNFLKILHQPLLGVLGRMEQIRIERVPALKGKAAHYVLMRRPLNFYTRNLV
jgi:hypothetical protein